MAEYLRGKSTSRSQEITLNLGTMPTLDAEPGWTISTMTIGQTDVLNDRRDGY